MEQTHITYLKAIRIMLFADRKITVAGVFNEIRTLELRKFISILRNDEGLNIAGVWTKGDSGKKFKTYSLIKE
jgi:hypothetical protein